MKNRSIQKKSNNRDKEDNIKEVDFVEGLQQV